MTLSEAQHVVARLLLDAHTTAERHAIEIVLKHSLMVTRPPVAKAVEMDEWDEFFADPRNRAMMEGYTVHNRPDGSWYATKDDRVRHGDDLHNGD